MSDPLAAWLRAFLTPPPSCVRCVITPPATGGQGLDAGVRVPRGWPRMQVMSLPMHGCVSGSDTAQGQYIEQTGSH